MLCIYFFLKKLITFKFFASQHIKTVIYELLLIFFFLKTDLYIYFLSFCWTQQFLLCIPRLIDFPVAHKFMIW